MESLKEEENGQVRLCILQALHGQPDYRLSEVMISSVLATYALRNSRDYLVTQLKWLSEEAGAIKLREVGETYIAELNQTGEGHVERRRILHGVKKPSAARS